MISFCCRCGHDRSLRFVFAMVVLLTGAGQADARPARPAPALPAPTGTVVNVSTEAQLQAAMGAIASNVTIVLAPGTYRLTRSLYFNGAYGGLTNVGIRGATDNSEDVVLIGPGMTQDDYGSVPYGIWTGEGVDGITIANMTIRDFYFHPIIFNAGTRRPYVHNVHLIDAGQQFIKSNPDAAGVGASNGVVEYSVFEFTTTARDDYPKAIDVQGGANWMIRHNLFRNLQAPAGQLIGPAVLVWRGSSNTLTEGNTFVNCGRGIMYGAEDAPGFAHTGGVVRNNFFYRGPSQYGDVGIQIADSPDTQVVNNTVLLSGTYSAAIEYRYPGASGLLIANNLVDGAISAREGATATLTTNLTAAVPGMFANAASGDLHLLATALVAIDQGSAVSGLANDWDGDSRPSGMGIDIGADEYVAPAVIRRVAGRVIASDNGAGVAAVRISLSGAANRLLATDANGAYSFQNLTDGDNYTVTAQLDGYTVMPEARYYFPLTDDALAADFVATRVVTVNQPPTVTLHVTSQSIAVGDRLTLTATASDPDGSVAGVAFYLDQKLLTNDTTTPYATSWKASRAGTFSFVAMATDAAGASTPSAPVTVIVKAKTRR